MVETDQTEKLEVDAMMIAEVLKLASRPPIPKPNLVENEMQVEKEPNIVNESENETTIQNVVTEDSQNNSGVVQPSQKVTKEQVKHGQTSSDTMTKYVTESRRITTSEKIFLSSTVGEQISNTNIFQQSEKSNDSFSEGSSDGEMDNENDSDFDWSEEEGEDINITTKTATKKPSQKRRPVARNAREFIARLHQKEVEAGKKKHKQRRNKRKAGATNGKEFKRLKTTNNSFESDILASFTSGMIGELNDGEPLAPAMPEIDANTHQKQFALLKDNIPEGADTRRTKTQGRDLREAVKLFGYKKVKASSGKWLLKGMRTALHGHQLAAAAWMVKRELARAGPFGGLIADEMGMGKTITSLACVEGNPPENDDLETYIPGTLVIVPNLNIAHQWANEAEKHCSDVIRKSVMIHQSKQRNIPVAMYEDLRMVITTTKEVQGYFRRVPSNEVRKDEILGSNWYRIILDEAHSIKNLKSLTKQSMCALRAKHRWALTGTPLSNTATEFLPYLRFIGFNVEECKKSFRKEYMDENKANKKFETLISSFMYRRTQRDQFLGHAIVPIPPSKTHDIYVPLTVEENVIYEFVKNRCSRKTTEPDEEQAETEKPQEAGGSSSEATVTKSEEEKINKKSRRISMDLRRLISHPYNIERLLRRLEEASQIQELRDSIQQCGETQTVLQQILSDKEAKLSLEKYESGLTEMRNNTNAAFGGKFKFDRYLEAIQAELHVRDNTCIECQTYEPKKPVIMPKCNHVYCGRCFQIQLDRICQTSADIPLTCVADGCNVPLWAAGELETMSVIVDSALANKNYHPPDIDDNMVTLPREKDQIGLFISSSIIPELSMVPNSRLTTAMTVLLSWRTDFPDDKIIVFTDNVITAKVLGSMLNHAQMGFVYYYGCMVSKKKTKALEMFKKSPNTKVFLAGLRCGGQSLNITCANRVIIIDPWWNKTSELQAAGRTSRIGQTKHCYVVRIFTSAATDERLVQLQKNKSEEVDHALQDDGHVPEVLDYNERRELFNKTRGD